MWEMFQSVDGTPFCRFLIIWFTSIGLIHINTEYSVGVVVANLPRSERYKIENVIVGVLPGPKEPQKHTYLKPLVGKL